MKKSIRRSLVCLVCLSPEISMFNLRPSDAMTASSIHTFDENYHDSEDYNIEDEVIPARDQILVVSNTDGLH